jgi:5'-nucleotidase
MATSSKKVAPAFAAFAILFAALVHHAIAQQPPVTVQLLAINDFHGNLEPPRGSDGLINQTPAGGAEYLATHLHNAVRDNPNSIVVAAGDLIGASPLISALLHDEPAVEAMNAMNMSVSAIGNHELDHGPAQLRVQTTGGCPGTEACSPGEKRDAAHYQYLAANMVADDGKTVLPATAIRTVGGVKIGFIGETLKETSDMVTPNATTGLHFLEESATANTAARELERQGIHAIVLLIHQGGHQEPSQRGTPLDPNGCENLEGPIKMIAEKLSPSIKVVISGHTHLFYNCEISGHIVTSASAFGRMFTRIALTIDPTSDAILSAKATNEVVTRDVPKDPAITAIIEKYRPAALRVTNQPVGSVAADITRTPNAAGESALGDVIADAQLASVSAPDKGGAAVAFMNAGGIRTNLLGPSDGAATRDVSYGDLYAAQPFGNQVLVKTMTGDMLRRLLEQQLAALGDARLQISTGFTYQYRMNAPAGQRVVPGSIKLNGRALQPTDSVRVEASDFLYQGGNGLTVFREATDPVSGPSDIDALSDYVRAHSPLSPPPLNRIVRLD